MGSYNFGNTKHGPVIINDDPPFNAASARHRYANNPYYVTPNSFSFLKRFANVTMPNSASYDGEGVDIIIMDTGVDATHPEFFDTNGNSRVVQIDWYSHMSSAIQSRYQPSINDLTSFGIDYYTSTHREHGTLVASAAAGIKHGYAKGAKIIDCPVRLGTGQYEGQKYIDLGAGRRKFVLPSISDATNAIVNWKNSRTGSDANRPVIVNMSFGIETLLRLKELESITYRGTTTNRSGTGNSRFGTWQIQDLINAGFYNAAMQRPRFDYSNNRFMYEIQNEFESPNGVLTVDSLDADINSLTNLGIHITIAAGNSSRYRVPPGHADYDNYVTLTYGKKHYWCRGDNNRTDAILCGASKALPAYNLSTFPSSVSPTWTRASDGEDFRSGYSGFGPGIDLYAVADRNWQALPVNLKVSDPGGGIRHYKTYDGNTDTNHQEIFYGLGGTSTAAPVVAGLLATYLERYPTKTPAQAKTDMKSMGISSKIHSISDSTVLSNSSDFNGWWDHTTGNPVRHRSDIWNYFESTNNIGYAHIGSDTPLLAHNTDLAITSSVAADPPEEFPPPDPPDTPAPIQPKRSGAALSNLTLQNVIIR